MSLLLELFHKKEGERIIPHSFYETSIFITPRVYKARTKIKKASRLNSMDEK
jgi:hypothetical protein